MKLLKWLVFLAALPFAWLIARYTHKYYHPYINAEALNKKQKGQRK